MNNLSEGDGLFHGDDIQLSDSFYDCCSARVDDFTDNNILR
jgi:hypothetical protein